MYFFPLSVTVPGFQTKLPLSEDTFTSILYPGIARKPSAISGLFMVRSTDVLPEEAPEEVLEEPDEAVLPDEEEPELPEELLEEPEEAAGAPGTVISSVLLVTVLPL